MTNSSLISHVDVLRRESVTLDSYSRRLQMLGENLYTHFKAPGGRGLCLIPFCVLKAEPHVSGTEETLRKHSLNNVLFNFITLIGQSTYKLTVQRK